jgi:dTDP-4-dehydrorhamnose reductase
VVTGGGGQLGTDAVRLFQEDGHDVIATDVASLQSTSIRPLDITDTEATRKALLDWRPDLVFHGAACTNVDGCERDPDLAYRVNALGTWSVASACREIDAALVAISTDFVFSGDSDRPYMEFDQPNPVSHYGASKLAGERLAQTACPRTYIVRTSWLYGVHGKNFPYTMINLARTRPELSVVADQVGTPTYSIDLVDAIKVIIKGSLYGIYHVSNAGCTTWHGFARAVLDRAGFQNVSIEPITSAEFPSPTKRPAYSVMRRYALELMGKDDLRPWEAALDDFIAAAHSQGKL